MVAWVDPVVHALDPALLVDKKTLALRMLRAKVLAGTVCQRRRAAAIAKQWKLEPKLLRKSGVLLRRVETGAQHLDTVLVVILLMVAEPASLERSARRVGLRVKPQQYLSPAES